jgi:hypothetical protein
VADPQIERPGIIAARLSILGLACFAGQTA